MSSTIVVLGASGMLGHRLVRHLARSRPVVAVARRPIDLRRVAGPFASRVAGEILEDLAPPALGRMLDRHRPAGVVNAIGIVKQRPSAADRVSVIRVNALFPHELALDCRDRGVRLIHISTDCVFSGRRGAYTEADEPDATDLYGRSKLLGEVALPGCLTLRTSLIGPELDSSQGLLEWFRARRDGTVHGYRRAVFSGLPTIRFARLVGILLDEHPTLSGIYHVAAGPISKFDLLRMINACYGLRVSILPADEPVYDRSLDGRRFAAASGFDPEPWPALINEMAQDEAGVVV